MGWDPDAFVPAPHDAVGLALDLWLGTGAEQDLPSSVDAPTPDSYEHYGRVHLRQIGQDPFGPTFEVHWPRFPPLQRDGWELGYRQVVLRGMYYPPTGRWPRQVLLLTMPRAQIVKVEPGRYAGATATLVALGPSFLHAYWREATEADEQAEQAAREAALLPYRRAADEAMQAMLDLLDPQTRQLVIDTQHAQAAAMQAWRDEQDQVMQLVAPRQRRYSDIWRAALMAIAAPPSMSDVDYRRDAWRAKMTADERAVYDWFTANGVDELLPRWATVLVRDGKLTYQAFRWRDGQRGWDADLIEVVGGDCHELRTVPLLTPLNDEVRGQMCASWIELSEQ